jgi:hypothetical protein
MNVNNAKRQRSLYLISAFILAAGLISAGWIYWSAQNDGGDESGYEIVGGFVYPNSSESSKKYVHDLQLYGGKAAVLADSFMRWWFGLWHGKSLASTVVFLTLVASLAFFLAARGWFSHAPHHAKNEDLKSEEAEQSNKSQQ